MKRVISTGIIKQAFAKACNDERAPSVSLNTFCNCHLHGLQFTIRRLEVAVATVETEMIRAQAPNLAIDWPHGPAFIASPALLCLITGKMLRRKCPPRTRR